MGEEKRDVRGVEAETLFRRGNMTKLHYCVVGGRATRERMTRQPNWSTMRARLAVLMCTRAAELPRLAADDEAGYWLADDETEITNA